MLLEKVSTFDGVAGEYLLLKDVPIPISRICEYVTLHGKRDIANVIKVENGELILDYLGGPSLII